MKNYFNTTGWSFVIPVEEIKEYTMEELEEKLGEKIKITTNK